MDDNVPLVDEVAGVAIISVAVPIAVLMRLQVLAEEHGVSVPALAGRLIGAHLSSTDDRPSRDGRR